MEQVETIFGDESLSVDDFLSILRSGMLACDYRTVPATVDVVNVKKYDLIQPHSAPYVFALGMTQSHFPKVGQNKSLMRSVVVSMRRRMSTGDWILLRRAIVSEVILWLCRFSMLLVNN